MSVLFVIVSVKPEFTAPDCCTVWYHVHRTNTVYYEQHWRAWPLHFRPDGNFVYRIYALVLEIRFEALQECQQLTITLYIHAAMDKDKIEQRGNTEEKRDVRIVVEPADFPQTR